MKTEFTTDIVAVAPAPPEEYSKITRFYSQTQNTGISFLVQIG